MAVENLKDSINTSISILNQYQKGKKRLIKTNRPWFDKPGGVLLQSIILLLGASFSGKTTELQNITDDIMNPEINPDADKFVVLSHSLEMSSFNLTLKDVKKITNLDYKDILSSNFSEEHKEALGKYFDTKRDGRYFINHETGTAEEIVKQTEDFLKKHTDKELVLIELDHLGLLKSLQGGKKNSIDDLVEMMNDLKLKYPNFLLILLTQANRNVYSRISEKSNEMKLSRNDVYQSDASFHIASYCIGLQNAKYLGVEEYRKIRPDKYPHLEHRFTEPDSNSKVSLHTDGCIFVEVLKDRMVDDLDFIDLYTIEMKPFIKPEDLPKSTSTLSTMPVFPGPMIIERDAPIEPGTVEDAFGVGSVSDDPPF